MVFAHQTAEKIATDLTVIGFVAAAGREIAQVSAGDFPVEASASKAVVVTAAGKNTAEDFGAAVVAVEQLVAYLVSENWQAYWRAPLVPLDSPLGSVKHQRYSAC
jgi:flagellar biosynthesis/type III secretory pathway ATPase